MFASWKSNQFPTDYMWIVLLGTKVTPDIHPAFLLQKFSEVKVQLLYFPEREKNIWSFYDRERCHVGMQELFLNVRTAPWHLINWTFKAYMWCPLLEFNRWFGADVFFLFLFKISSKTNCKKQKVYENIRQFHVNQIKLNLSCCRSAELVELYTGFILSRGWKSTITDATTSVYILLNSLG